MEHICAGSHCGRPYVPNPRVKHQKYCCRPECQRERKSLWHKRKLKTDDEYKQNRTAAQQGWRGRHPDYWRNYRKAHPEYGTRNRELQRERNKKARCVAVRAGPICGTMAKTDNPASSVAKTDEPVIAKTDALTSLISGTYQLIPVLPGMIAKTDALFVQLSLLSSAYG
jgi:hypothetical protein